MYRSMIIAMMALLAALLMSQGAVLAQTTDSRIVEPEPRVELEVETRDESLTLEHGQEWETYGYDDSEMRLEKKEHLEHRDDTFGFDEREDLELRDKKWDKEMDEDIYGFDPDRPGRRPMADRQQMMERMRILRQERLDKMDEIIAMLDEAETAIDEQNLERAKELLDSARTELEVLKDTLPGPPEHVPGPPEHAPGRPEHTPGRPEPVPPVTPTEPEVETETGTSIPGWPGSQRHYSQLV